LNFSDFKTIAGRTWRIAGCRDYWSKYESPWCISSTANQFDAIEAVELVLADYQHLFGHPLADEWTIDPATSEMLAAVTTVIDNSGPFQSCRFEVFITSHPVLRHVRTRVKSPGQNGSRERSVESLKYERLYLHEITDVLDLIEHAEDYRQHYNTYRPHSSLGYRTPNEFTLDWNNNPRLTKTLVH
jgi:transposase InsO family protein